MRKRTIETISTGEIPGIREVTPPECSIPFNVTPSGVVFNDNTLETDQPLDTVLINESSINEELMELINLAETAIPQQGTSDAALLSLCSPVVAAPSQISSFVTLEGNQECTTNEQETHALMDDPLTDQFSDLTSLLLNPTFISTLSSSSLQTFEPADNILDLVSPADSLTTTTSNSPLSTSPPTPCDNTVPSCSPLPLERKRKQSSIETNDNDHLPATKKEKYVERRKKNNVASQVSRAKRRQKNSDLFQREKELEKQNADLRVKVEEMTKEAERLKKMLIDQLAH